MSGYKQKGFTLLELMIVCLLIAIVVGMAVPAYLTSKLQAEAAKAANNLYSIYQAHKLYYAEQPSSAPVVAPTSLADLTLYIDIRDDDGDWDYSLPSSNAGPPPTFTGRADHKLPDGSYDGWVMEIDETGSITHTNRPY